MQLLAAAFAILGAACAARPTPAAPSAPATALAPGDPSTCGAPRDREDLVHWIRAGGVPFLGTVTNLAATSPDESAAQRAKHPVFVRIDKLWLPSCCLHERDVVMVAMNDAPTFALGDEAYFFARAWIDGRMHNFVEVAHVAAADHPELARDIPGVLRWIDNRGLYERLSRAQTIVLGKVASSRTVGDAITASIDVARVLAGPATAPSIEVHFDECTGNRHYCDLPALPAGRDVILLLQPMTGAPGAVFALRGRDDLPAADLQRVIDLLNCPPPPLP